MKAKCLSAVLLLIFVLSTNLNAAYFDIDFDNDDDGLLGLPFVGSGSFEFDGPATDGIFFLQDLSNYRFDFQFDTGDVFTTADIITPIEELLIIISNSGFQVNFGNIHMGSPSTPPGGALDFQNSSGSQLSFEPGDGVSSIGTLYVMNGYFGNYTDAVVPAPGALLLFVSGLLGLAGFRRITN